jgi:hypothetical protein
MKITSDPKRIEQAHSLLQSLEDETIGYMENKPYCNPPLDANQSAIFNARLTLIHRA